MNFSRNQIIIIGIAGSAVVFFALVFAGIIPGLKLDPGSQAPRVVLNVFGTDEESAFTQVAALYSQIRPNVTINYTRIEEADYNQTLLRALASGFGPDVFFIKNSQVLQYRQLIAPIPTNQISSSQLDRIFPAVVKNDFGSEEGTYALPLYIDTLALFYNKDLFNARGIALPPKNWTEFQDAVLNLVKIDGRGNVEIAGAALGGSAMSIEHAPDILSLIMLQLGVPLPNIGGALSAVSFYLRFSDSSEGTYTWNDRMPNSLDAFAQGKTGMIFGYARDIARLKAKGPHLNYGIAQMIQFADATPVNFASYNGLAVSRQSRNAAWAWDFVVNTATNSQIAAQYANLTGKPPAMRELIAQTVADTETGIFARQALSARSVATKDDNVYKSALSDMIARVLSGKLTLSAALNEASATISAIR